MQASASLDDLRVLDISQGIAGPLCAKILGDFGAHVIKIEPPEGEVARRMPPFYHDEPHHEKSLVHLLLNTNKKGVTLKIDTDAGSGLFRELVKQSDIIVESFPPGYLESLGLGYSSLEKINPEIILTSITGFGQTGPYSGYKSEEIVAYAMGMIMSISGTTDGEPLKHGGFQSQYEGGISGAMATAAAALMRDFTGEGQHVDVSIQEVVNWTLVHSFSTFSWNGGVVGRRNPEGTMFGNVMPCKDGYFITQLGQGTTWDKLVDFYGKEELREERFADPGQRLANGPELDSILVDAAKDRSVKELFSNASKERILVGMVQTPKDLSECPQLESRNFYQEVEHPVVGKIRLPYTMFNMSETPAQYQMPAPLLGQHTTEIFHQLLGRSENDIVSLKEQGVI